MDTLKNSNATLTWYEWMIFVSTLYYVITAVYTKVRKQKKKGIVAAIPPQILLFYCVFSSFIGLAFTSDRMQNHPETPFLHELHGFYAAIVTLGLFVISLSLLPFLGSALANIAGTHQKVADSESEIERMSCCYLLNHVHIELQAVFDIGIVTPELRGEFMRLFECMRRLTNELVVHGTVSTQEVMDLFDDVRKLKQQAINS